jgi:hypothetical protein
MVMRLARGWTVRGSNLGRGQISTLIWTGPGAQPASYIMGTGFFPGMKCPGVALPTYPHLARRLKKEQVKILILIFV